MWWWVLISPGVTRQPSARSTREADGGSESGPLHGDEARVAGHPAAGDLPAVAVHGDDQVSARHQQVDQLAHGRATWSEIG